MTTPAKCVIQAITQLTDAEVPQPLIRQLMDKYEQESADFWGWEAIDIASTVVCADIKDLEPANSIVYDVARQILRSGQVLEDEAQKLLQVLRASKATVRGVFCAVFLSVSGVVRERGYQVQLWEEAATCILYYPRLCLIGCEGCDSCTLQCDCSEAIE